MFRYLQKTVANKAIFAFMDLLKSSSDDIIEAYFEKIQSVIVKVSYKELSISK